jgi:hypothetical protein
MVDFVKFLTVTKFPWDSGNAIKIGSHEFWLQWTYIQM